MVRWNAEDYCRHSTAQQSWAQELIGKLRLRGTEHVLDIGCGDGKVTAEIARLVPGGRVLGIDTSAEMVSFATESFPADARPNQSFEVMDARELAFDGVFDVVFSNATLHWVIDHSPVLRGIARALKPGGRCLLQMGGRGNAAAFFETVLSSGPVHDRWGRYFADMPFPYGFYGPEEYMPMLRGVGLTPVRVELIPKDMTQQGPEGLAGWVRTTWMPYTQRIPEEHRDRYISEWVEEYLAHYPLDEHCLAHVAMVRLEAEAVRIKG